MRRICTVLLLLWLVTAPAATAATCPPDQTERYEPRSFLGYACEGDCERHKAGYAWAEQRWVTDATACAGLGPLAREGCQAYVEEPLTAEAAGHRWAIENEITRPCACEGAGARFRAGCRAALACPPGGPATCAEAWPRHVQPFQRHGSHR